MFAEELRKVIDFRPFEPFRLHLSTGEKVDIRHPELAMLTRAWIIVGVGGRGGIAESTERYNLVHVVRIQILNGHQPKQPRAPRKKKS